MEEVPEEPPAVTGRTAIPAGMFALSRGGPSEGRAIRAALLSGTKGASPRKEEFAMSLLVIGLRLPDRAQSLAGQWKRKAETVGRKAVLPLTAGWGDPMSRTAWDECWRTSSSLALGVTER